MRLRRTLRMVVAGITIAALGIQFVPYGRAHTNPPVRQEPAWDSATTRALAVRACFDCHSNETVWPWYSHVAPVSWRIQQHVDEGRRAMNLSEWDRPQEEADDAAETVADGTMPPLDYLLLHPSANLSPQERDALIHGLLATLASGERDGNFRERRADRDSGRRD